jgi:hypothetical protein
MEPLEVLLNASRFGYRNRHSTSRSPFTAVTSGLPSATHCVVLLQVIMGGGPSHPNISKKVSPSITFGSERSAAFPAERLTLRIQEPPQFKEVTEIRSSNDTRTI